MKVILCAKSQTQSIIDKLENNVGGIELIGVSEVTGLKKAMLSAGKVNKIIILEAALDTTDLDFLAEQEGIQTILILKDEAKMQQFDLKYFINENISIVNFKDKTLNLLFIKQLITSPVDKSLLFKSDPNKSLTQKKEEIIEEEVKKEAPVQRIVKSEDEEEEPVSKKSEPENKPKLQSLFRPERKVSAKKEEELIAPIKAYKDPKQELRDKISTFKDGCIIGMIGMPGSYNTSTTLNLARTAAVSDMNVLIIDTDFFNIPYGAITESSFKDLLKDQKDNKIVDVLRGQSILSNSYLFQTNLMILTNPIIADAIDITDKSINDMFDNLMKKIKHLYNVIFLDIRMEDLRKYPDFIRYCNLVVFNIPMTNKDLISFMRTVETMENSTIRERIFDSKYIAVDDKNKCLLNTKKKDLTAIDDFLKDNFNIVNKDKYVDLKRVGDITTDEKKDIDYLMKTPKLDEKFYLDLLNSIID